MPTRCPFYKVGQVVLRDKDGNAVRREVPSCTHASYLSAMQILSGVPRCGGDKTRCGVDGETPSKRQSPPIVASQIEPRVDFGAGVALLLVYGRSDWHLAEGIL